MPILKDLRTSGKVMSTTQPTGQTNNNVVRVRAADAHKPSWLALDCDKLEILEGVLPFSNIEDLITLFLSETNHHLICVHTNQSEANLNALAREAHSMVSNAANVGAMEVSDLAQALEQACEEGGTASVERLVPQLVEACATATIALKEWVKERHSRPRTKMTGQG